MSNIEMLEDLYPRDVVEEIEKYVIELNRYNKHRYGYSLDERKILKVFTDEKTTRLIKKFYGGRAEEVKTMISLVYEVLSMLDDVSITLEIADTINKYSFDKNVSSKLAVYLMYLTQTDDRLVRDALEIYNDNNVVNALRKYDTDAAEFFVFEVYNSIIETGLPKFAKKIKRLVLAYQEEPVYGYEILKKYSSVFENAVLNHIGKGRHKLRGDAAYSNLSNKEWKVVGYLGEILIANHHNPQKSLELVDKVYRHVIEKGFDWHEVKRIINREIAKF